MAWLVIPLALVSAAIVVLVLRLVTKLRKRAFSAGWHQARYGYHDRSHTPHHPPKPLPRPAYRSLDRPA